MSLRSLLARNNRKRNNHTLKDASIVVLSVLVALIMVKTDLLVGVIHNFSGFRLVGSFFAGMFFTTIFTTAPAIVALGEIAKENSIFLTALLGGLGASLGDLIIFRFVRDSLGDHLNDLLSHERWWKRMHHLIFHMKYFRWLTFFIGGVILASPLPDELGVSFLGLSRMKTKNFVPISFIFNFFGILAIGILAKYI